MQPILEVFSKIVGDLQVFRLLSPPLCRSYCSRHLPSQCEWRSLMQNKTSNTLCCGCWRLRIPTPAVCFIWCAAKSADSAGGGKIICQFSLKSYYNSVLPHKKHILYHHIRFPESYINKSVRIHLFRGSRLSYI